MNEHHVTSRLLTGTPVATLGDSAAGAALAAARAVTPDVLIDLLTDAGLRGRGGAGFPTGLKWRTVASYTSPSEPTPVVVNAAEGEPGTFKDRAILLENPYRVLEGALIAAHAIGAVEVIVVTKASFVHERRRLESAIEEITAAGLADGVSMRIVAGPGSYLFGEETGLLEVVEGRPPFPRVSPPFRRGVDPAARRTGHSASGAAFAEQGGGWFAPALVDNVETLANVPGIVEYGAAWFRELGTPTSPGSIVCTVSGSTQRHGVGEFAMGTPLRTVIAELGGEVTDGRRIAAVLCGASGCAGAAGAARPPVDLRRLRCGGPRPRLGQLHRRRRRRADGPPRRLDGPLPGDRELRAVRAVQARRPGARRPAARAVMGSAGRSTLA